MSVFVTISCDRCTATLGHGESIETARQDSRMFGAVEVCSRDLCSVCVEEDPA